MVERHGHVGIGSECVGRGLGGSLPRPRAQGMCAGGGTACCRGRGLRWARSTDADGEGDVRGLPGQILCTRPLDFPPLIDGFVRRRRGALVRRRRTGFVRRRRPGGFVRSRRGGLVRGRPAGPLWRRLPLVPTVPRGNAVCDAPRRTGPGAMRTRRGCLFFGNPSCTEKVNMI